MDLHAIFLLKLKNNLQITTNNFIAKKSVYLFINHSSKFIIYFIDSEIWSQLFVQYLTETKMDLKCIRRICIRLRYILIRI